MNKKITLSINTEAYNEFQKYCNDNALMLSKKIELLMRDIMVTEDGKHIQN